MYIYIYIYIFVYIHMSYVKQYLCSDGADSSNGLYTGATLATIAGPTGAQEIMKRMRVGMYAA